VRVSKPVIAVSAAGVAAVGGLLGYTAWSGPPSVRIPTAAPATRPGSVPEAPGASVPRDAKLIGYGGTGVRFWQLAQDRGAGRNGCLTLARADGSPVSTTCGQTISAAPGAAEFAPVSGPGGLTYYVGLVGDDLTLGSLTFASGPPAAVTSTPLPAAVSTTGRYFVLVQPGGDHGLATWQLPTHRR
jgi:hypothetical protein